MEEERWIRMLRGLNILPLVVCTLIEIIIIGGRPANSLLLFPVTIFCLISYVSIYFTELQEQRNNKMGWIFATNLISTTFWLVVFSAFSFRLLKTIDIISVLLTVFVVGYPLWMLYYNFRLFMDEISKP